MRGRYVHARALRRSKGSVLNGPGVSFEGSVCCRPLEEPGMSAATSAPAAPPAPASTVEDSRGAGQPGRATDDDRALERESSDRGDRARVVSGFNGNRRVPPPVNEPVKSYAPGSPERAALKERLRSMAAERADIPLIIGGNEVHTGELVDSMMPHDHRHVLGQWHRANPANVDEAITAAQRAAKDWANWAWEDRAAVFLKAAELLATTWRSTLNAATMLGQSKTAFKAEIDAACELIDFWRFNPHYA